MALRLEKTLKGGISGNYWKIIQTKSDFVSGITTAILGLYKDETQRAVDVGNFFHTEAVKLIGSDLTRDQVYQKMKVSQIDGEGHETNEWANAEAV